MTFFVNTYKKMKKNSTTYYINNTKTGTRGISFHSLANCLLNVREKNERKLLAHFASLKKAKKTKIWGDQAVQRRTSEVFGSERPWVLFLTKKNG